VAEHFDGVMGRTIDESRPAWPPPIRAAAGAPNILYWVIDDTGFGQLAPFGGLIEMPTLQRLVDAGLQYTNFHTTALCSPTRSCLLTGRNHHSNHMACVTECATGFPGSDGRIPLENGFLSEMLTPHGYAAYAVGKWHLTPDEDNTMGASRERWPLGRGFERFYGFLGGETDQYEPDLVYDNHVVPPPRTAAEGYHLTEDLTDKAIEFIQDLKAVAPSKPFFLYLAYGANHAPHHVPKEWADRYKGRFDIGWDKLREVIHQRQLEMGIIPPGTELSPRDPDVPEWDALSDDQKRLYTRFMEVFAGFSTHMDDHVGRLLTFLEDLGELDNTLIVFVSDNGASAEGGPTGSVNENLFFNMAPDDLQRNLTMLDELGGPLTYNHYPWGWTWAGNTPLRRWKRETYQGGMTDPFVVSWPAGIAARGEKRRQYVHAIDLVPTVLEVLGIAPPEFIKGVPQAPIEGISFAYTFANAGAPSRHLTQYYEMFGHRAIYHDGWKAVCPWPGPSFAEAGRGFGEELTATDLARLEATGWELYHVAVDFSESHNVAAAHPDKLREMVARWWTEAGKYNVLPLDGRGQSRLAEQRPQIEAERTHYTYYPGGATIPERQAAIIKNRAHTITAHVEIPAGGAEGVLLQQGGRFGGYAFGLKNNKLHYVHNYLGVARYVISSDRVVAPGAHTLAFAFEKTGEPDIRSGKGAAGIGRLYIDGEQVGEGEIPVTVPVTYALTGGGLTCGRSEGTPVIEGYAPPFAFTGTLKRVVVDVSGAPVRDLEREGRIAMAVQ
jgi:arylsulfatase